MILPLTYYGNPVLRQKGALIEDITPELQELIDDMFETMYAAVGIGLAATQVNVHKRLLVLDVSEHRDQPRVYVNPQIIEREGSETCEEGCLSVPGIYAEVDRAARVRVSAQDRDGKGFEEELEGMHAICLQHEIDHLNGKLFVDYLSGLKRNRIRKQLEKQHRQARV